MDHSRQQDLFSFFCKFLFVWTKSYSPTQSDARMTLEDNLRGLIKQAQDNPPNLRLSQIAKLSGVEYNRLWRFVSQKHPDTLLSSDASQLYTALTGKLLLPPTDV